MRIGIVCPYSFDEPGGVQAHILDLARVLISHGHEVEVLGPACADTPLPEFVVRGGAAVPIPYNGSVARIAIGPNVRRRTREFIEQGRFDVLHIHEPNSPSFSMSALIQAEGALVATYHTSTTSSRALRAALPLLRPYLEKIRGGIAVSEMARRWQVEALGGDPVLIPNGVDTRIFQRAVEAMEDRPRGVDDPLRVVFLGRVNEARKGLTVLWEALRQLDTGSRAVEVAIAGSGELPDTVQATLTGRGEKLAAGVRVRHVGRISDDEKARLLAQADVYVAPNTGGESFGIVLVEAMAAHCAVVASDLEAFADVCAVASSEAAGVLFKNGDSADLARVLGELIADGRRREALSDAAARRAQRYDWQRVSAEIEAVYETVREDSPVRLAQRSTETELR